MGVISWVLHQPCDCVICYQDILFALSVCCKIQQSESDLQIRRTQTAVLSV